VEVVVVVGHPDVVVEHFQPTLEMWVKTVAETVAVVFVAPVIVVRVTVEELAAVAVVVFLGLEVAAGSSHVAAAVVAVVVAVAAAGQRW